MNSSESLLPRPIVTPVSRPFWDGCSEGVFRLQRCSQCAVYRFYPSESCQHCASVEYSWDTLSGSGKVASWIVIHRSVDPAWSARTPFATGIVEIDEQPGCFVPGVIEGIEPSEIKAGLRVRITYDQVDKSLAFPRWQALLGD